uniref:Uncharacterized protein n=1 Tax=Mycena chlorophos TaxID=658473 RepID=A0ABQ0LLG5_MYCCL|nr:predicted protein [Mycena chlorophos]
MSFSLSRGIDLREGALRADAGSCHARNRVVARGMKRTKGIGAMKESPAQPNPPAQCFPQPHHPPPSLYPPGPFTPTRAASPRSDPGTAGHAFGLPSATRAWCQIQHFGQRRRAVEHNPFSHTGSSSALITSHHSPSLGDGSRTTHPSGMAADFSRKVGG